MRLSRAARNRALNTTSTEKPRYLVQIGRERGSYETKYSFPKGKVGTALKYYHSLNIGNGYKKRIVDLDSGEILDRETS